MLVAVASPLGVALAIAATSASRPARAASAASSADDSAPARTEGTVAALMKSEVFSLGAEDSVMDAPPESDGLAEAFDDLVELPVMRLATREVVTVRADASIAEAVSRSRTIWSGTAAPRPSEFGGAGRGRARGWYSVPVPVRCAHPRQGAEGLSSPSPCPRPPSHACSAAR